MSIEQRVKILLKSKTVWGGAVAVIGYLGDPTNAGLITTLTFGLIGAAKATAIAMWCKGLGGLLFVIGLRDAQTKHGVTQ